MANHKEEERMDMSAEPTKIYVTSPPLSKVSLKALLYRYYLYKQYGELEDDNIFLSNLIIEIDKRLNKESK
jgi:hypothetical protein